MSFSTLVKLTTSTQTDNTLGTNVDWLRIFTMRNTFNPFCQCDKSYFNFFGSVQCPKKIWLLAQKGKSISRQKQPSISSRHVNGSGALLFCKTLFLQDQNRFSRCVTKKFLDETQRSLQCFIRNVYCLGRFCSRQKCVGPYMEKNGENCYNCVQCKSVATFRKVLLRNKNRQLSLLKEVLRDT